MFYPLGSCTMKYNPRGAHKAAGMPGFLGRHPLAPRSRQPRSSIACMHDLQEILKDVTGMQGVSLAPMAGAQGEFAGVAMIRAYHEARGDDARTEIIVPTAAHGTNPATAVMCGYKVTEVPVNDEGDVDLEALKEKVGPQTAGLMMTNPSTCGVFERQIQAIAATVHDAGGLLYYDGANLNAILGKVKPGDMGFDVLHMNLHKTFATPHGGGGPGAGPVGVGERLLPHLPLPVVEKLEEPSGHRYRWMGIDDLPGSIGTLSGFAGNAGILLRALSYALCSAARVCIVLASSPHSMPTMAARLAKAGFQLAYPSRRATHEFIVTYQKENKELGVNAMDMAKRLLDYGVHSPTTYFPLLVPECFLVNQQRPKANRNWTFVDAMIAVREEALQDADFVKQAPYTTPVRRLDDVKAARELDLIWSDVSAG